LAVFKDSGKQSQARKLVKFLTSDAEQIELNKELYQIPSTVSASKNAYFQTPNMKIFNSILQQHAQPVPTGKGAYGVINAYGTAIVNLFRQGANSHSITKSQVSAALAKADATADATGGQ
jgi:multiple sugar transport system substrate-binding protein